VGVLRTVLALCVVGEHSGGIFGLPLVPGFIAVQIFYVASGFYMALILTEKYVGRGAWRAFYVNRFLRLFPIYYVVLALTLAGAAISVASGRALPDYLSGWREFGGSVAAWKLMAISLPNFTILGLDLLHFLDIRPSGTISLAVEPAVGLHDFAAVGRHFSVVPQAWTLGIELMFYAIVPSIVRWRSSALFLLLAGCGMARAIGYGLGFAHDPWDDRFFPFELSLFVAGMLLYRGYRRFSAEPDPVRRRRLAAFGWSGLAAGVGATLLFGIFTSDPDFASVGYGLAVNLAVYRRFGGAYAVGLLRHAEFPAG
jgi:peptidoglycan/LPS O-acetylase OafA/YrhL